MVAMRNFSSRAANPDKMPMKNAKITMVPLVYLI